jgi:hypothetical protein
VWVWVWVLRVHYCCWNCCEIGLHSLFGPLTPSLSLYSTLFFLSACQMPEKQKGVMWERVCGGTRESVCVECRLCDVVCVFMIRLCAREKCNSHRIIQRGDENCRSKEGAKKKKRNSHCGALQFDALVQLVASTEKRSDICSSCKALEERDQLEELRICWVVKP